MSSSLEALVQIAGRWFPGPGSEAIGTAIHRALREADGPLTQSEIEAHIPAAARGTTALRNLLLQGRIENILGLWQNREENLLGYQLIEREAAEAIEVDAAEYFAQLEQKQKQKQRRRPARLRSVK